MATIFEFSVTMRVLCITRPLPSKITVAASTVRLLFDGVGQGSSCCPKTQGIKTQAVHRIIETTRMGVFRLDQYDDSPSGVKRPVRPGGDQGFFTESIHADKVLTGLSD